MASSRARRVQPRGASVRIVGWGEWGWGRYTQLRELVLEIDDDRACLGRLVLCLPYRLQGSPRNPTLCTKAKARAKTSRRKPARCDAVLLRSIVSGCSMQAMATMGRRRHACVGAGRFV